MPKMFAALFVALFFASSYSLELINANSNSNRFEDGAIVSELFGDVEFLYDDARIFSDQTVWRRADGHLLMTGNVRVLRPNQELKCDTVEFRSATRILQLRGNVFGVDTNYLATMLSGKADYFVRNDSVFLSETPRIHFWNKNSTDTITVFAQTLNYATQTGIARGDRNVKVVGKDFVSFADTGYYFAETKTAMKISNTSIEYENSTVSGDTIHIIFDENAVREFFVIGNPRGKTVETENGDSVFMELAGDTLRFLMQNQKVSQIISVNNAVISRFRGEESEKTDKIWARNITITLDCENEENADLCGENNRVIAVAETDARAIYHDGSSRNESAGDTLKLFFDDDGVSRVKISGQVKGRLQETP